jgi:hypothetical protein
MYKWVDENGITHYSNKRPKTNQKVEVSREFKYRDTGQQRNNHLDDVLKEYKEDEYQLKSRFSSTTTKKSRLTSKNDLTEYYENKIREQEKLVKKYDWDLQLLKRKPYSSSSYKSRKQQLKRYEDRLESARKNLDNTIMEFEIYKYESK